MTDADFAGNYTFRTSGMIDKGEELNCARCGKRSTEPGVIASAWTRTPNTAIHLPMAVDLCDVCSAQVKEIQEFERARDGA